MPDEVPQVTQSNDLFKKGSQFVDDLFRPVSQPLGDVLGRATAPLGPNWSQAFRSFGQQAPRLAADIALTTRGAPLPRALGFGDVALQSLGESADKGLGTAQRLVPAALQTGAFAAAPRVGGFGEQAATKLAAPIAAKLPTTAGALLQGAARRGGSALGAIGTFEAANAASAEVMNQPYNPFTPEHVAGVAASVLPFELLGLPHAIQQFKVDAHKLWYDKLTRNIQAEDAAKAPILTQQRESDQDVETPSLASPVAMETKPLPDWFHEAEKANRGMFSLTGPQRMLGEFGGKVNPTQAYGRLQNTLHPAEFDLYDKAGLMDQLTRAKNGSEVAKWMQEVGPKVEVKKVGEGATTPAQKEYRQLQHWYDSQTANRRKSVDEILDPSFGFAKPHDAKTEFLRLGFSEDDANKALRLDVLANQIRLDPSRPMGEASWSGIAPKPESDMPGYVEGAVTIPRTPHKSGGQGLYESDLFPESHSFPRNTLGFFRGYMEKRPDGGKTFHVIEVQSDWAQERRAQDEDPTRFVSSSNYPEAQDHPLLRDWERLTLKAAIDHAKAEGADRISVSDAETAMMTEGHDRAVPMDNPLPFNEAMAQQMLRDHRIDQSMVDEARQSGQFTFDIDPNESQCYRDLAKKYGVDWAQGEPSQSPGMRLHYDQILPRTLEELTGQKGVKETYGEHKMAVVDRQLPQEPGERAYAMAAPRKVPRADLIFKNQLGQPKTDVSATAFDLGKLKSLDKPWSLFGKDKLTTRLSKPLSMAAQDDLHRLEDLGMEPNDLVNAAERMAAFERKSGESLVDFYTRKLGINVDLNKPAKPTQLLSDARQMVEHYTKEILGMDDVQSGYWTDKYLRFVQMLGATQGETRLLPALAYTKNDQLKAACFYAPSRSNMPNAFIGIFQHTQFRPDRAMFEFFHSTGHELFHGAMLQGEGKSFAGNLPPKMVEAVKNLVKLSEEMQLTTGEMTQSINSVLRMMAGSPFKQILDYRSKHYTEDAAGRTEYMADLFGLMGMGAASPRKLGGYKTIDDLLRWTSDDVREFARGMFRDIGMLWDFMEQMLKKVFGWKTSSVTTVKDIAANMQHLIQSATVADKSVEAFLRTQDIRDARPWAPVSGVDYDRVEQLYRALGAEGTDKDVDAFRKEAATLVVPMSDKDLPKEIGLGKRLKWLDYINPQLGRSIPEWADTTWLGRNYQQLEREASMAMFSHYIDPQTGKWDVDKMVLWGRTGTSLNKAFNAVTLRQNALSGPDEGQRLSLQHVNEMPEVKALNDADRAFFHRMMDQTSAVMHESAVRRVNSFKARIAKTVSHAFMNADIGMRWHDASELGKALTDRFVDTDRLNGGQAADPKLFEDFAKAQVVLEKWLAKDPANGERLRSISEIFTLDKDGQPLEADAIPDIANKFMEYRGKLLGTWEPPANPGDQWHFSGKPGYTPEVRLGRWTIAWKAKDGRDQLVAFDKKDAFDARLKTLNKDYASGKLDYLKPFDKEDQADLFRGLRPDMYNTYVDAVTALNNRVTAKLKQLNPESTELINELRDELKPARAIAALIEAPYMKQRRLVGGRETLNMAQGVIHYINSTAHTIGKENARGEQRLFLNDPQMKSNPNLRSAARQYFNEIIDPSERGFGWFKSLMSLNYIFFSPSLAFVEFTQQLTNHFPALLNAGMNARDAVKAIKDANVEMAKATLKGNFRDHIYENPEKTAAVKWAVQNKVIDAGWLQDLFNINQDLPFINARNHLIGDGSILDRTGLIGKPLYHLYKFGRDAHSLAIRVNTEAAFTSAWEHLRTQVDPATGQKYTGDSLLRSAAELATESMHGGGRAMRPLWYLGVGNPNFGATAGGLMFFLQTYVYNTVSQLCRYSKNAIANSGLSTTERVSAAKAASAMIGSQMFLAGVMGLPVMAQVFALIEQAFPNTEPKRRAREMFFGLGKWLNSKVHLAGQDEQMGHFVADTAIDGLASQLTPWNMSNRFELGVLMGVDPYRGFNWKNVVGPGGDLLEQILLKPAQALSEGHPLDAAIQALPNSNVRRLATLASNGWNLRNKDDRLNLDLTNAEATSLALGFTPKRVAEFRELNEMKMRAEKVQALEQKKFHEELAAQLQNGQVGEVRSALLSRARDVENYDPREGARRVAELLQQRTEAFDPLRTGSRVGETYNVGQLFHDPNAGSTSEVQRLIQKQQTTQALGFPQGLGRSSLRVAELIDQLLALNPRMSPLEARAMLERQMHPARFGYYGQPQE